MNIYFAPLEGITGYLFRQVYERHFGGVDRYYAPFVTMRDGGFMKKKEKRDVLPENNPGICLIPQVMTNHAESFCQAARHMEQMGYRQVNLNLGCPSGTVVSKSRGAGFLRAPQDLDRFFESIFEHCPIDISVKTRIGFYEEEEFFELLKIYNRYPICELIIHPRTREDLYKGTIHRKIFDYAVEHSKNPLCYNGDLQRPEDISEIKKAYPSVQSVMIGRGFLMHPGFVRDDWDDREYHQKIFSFMEDLREVYKENFSGDTPVLFKMKEIWAFLKDSFDEGEDWFKKIKKTKKMSEYQAILMGMRESCR